MDPGLVLPVHPFEGSDLNLKNVFPSMVIDQLVLIRAVDVLGQRIVVRIPNAPGRGSDPRISEPIVIHNTDVLTPMIAVVNQPIGLLRAGDRLAGSGNASVRMESDHAQPTILRLNTSVTNGCIHKPLSRYGLRNPQPIRPRGTKIAMNQIRSGIFPPRFACREWGTSLPPSRILLPGA